MTPCEALATLDSGLLSWLRSNGYRICEGNEESVWIHHGNERVRFSIFGLAAVGPERAKEVITTALSIA